MGRALREARIGTIVGGLAIVALALAATPVSFGGTSERGATSCFYTPNGRKDACYTAYRDCPGCGWYWSDESATITIVPGNTAAWRWLWASEGNTDLADAQLTRPGRWNVYRAADQGFGFLGSVQRRSATRWNIRHRGKLVGYTKGPNPGVVGLFVLCRYL